MSSHHPGPSLAYLPSEGAFYGKPPPRTLPQSQKRTVCGAACFNGSTTIIVPFVSDALCDSVAATEIGLQALLPSRLRMQPEDDDDRTHVDAEEALKKLDETKQEIRERVLHVFEGDDFRAPLLRAAGQTGACLFGSYMNNIIAGRMDHSSLLQDSDIDLCTLNTRTSDAVVEAIMVQASSGGGSAVRDYSNQANSDSVIVLTVQPPAGAPAEKWDIVCLGKVHGQAALGDNLMSLLLGQTHISLGDGGIGTLECHNGGDVDLAVEHCARRVLQVSEPNAGGWQKLKEYESRGYEILNPPKLKQDAAAALTGAQQELAAATAAVASSAAGTFSGFPAHLE